MPFTSSDLTSIDAAIASGELTVEISGKRITYRSIGELLEARRLIAGDIAAQTTPPPQGAAFRVRFATSRE